jgi:hypothetical protein
MNMARRTRARAGSSVTVDFTGIEARVLLPEGDMLFEVTAVSKEKSDSSGGDMLVWDIEVAEGKMAGTSGPRIYTSLNENALWKLAGLLTALGVEVPDGPLDIDLAEMVGAQFMGVVTHEEYNQRMQARINDFYSVDDAPPAEEPEPAPRGRRGAKTEDDDPPARTGRRSRREEPEPEPEVEEAPARGRRGRRAEPEAEPEPATRRSRRGAKEETVAAPRGRRGRARELDPILEDDVHDMTEAELESLNDEYGLDADLESAKTLRKKAALIIDALEEKELLDSGK